MLETCKEHVDSAKVIHGLMKVKFIYLEGACSTTSGTAYHHENITPAIFYGGGNILTWAASLQSFRGWWWIFKYIKKFFKEMRECLHINDPKHWSKSTTSGFKKPKFNFWTGPGFFLKNDFKKEPYKWDVQNSSGRKNVL